MVYLSLLCKVFQRRCIIISYVLGLTKCYCLQCIFRMIYLPQFTLIRTCTTCIGCDIFNCTHWPLVHDMSHQIITLTSSSTWKPSLIARFMGPTWGPGRQDPGGPHVGHMNFPIWDSLITCIHLIAHRIMNAPIHLPIKTVVCRGL